MYSVKNVFVFRYHESTSEPFLYSDFETNTPSSSNQKRNVGLEWPLVYEFTAGWRNACNSCAKMKNQGQHKNVLCVKMTVFLVAENFTIKKRSWVNNWIILRMLNHVFSCILTFHLIISERSKANIKKISKSLLLFYEHFWYITSSSNILLLPFTVCESENYMNNVINVILNTSTKT